MVALANCVSSSYNVVVCFCAQGCRGAPPLPSCARFCVREVVVWGVCLFFVLIMEKKGVLEGFAWVSRNSQLFTITHLGEENFQR